MRPVGPISSPPAFLPRWLDVQTRGDVSTIVFRPDGRVRWQVTWSSGQVVEKVTTVDGERWARSRFARDFFGRLVRKAVDGPGALGGPWTFHYVTDAAGRVTSRRGLVTRRRPAGQITEEWRVAWNARGGASATLRMDGTVVRTDEYDDAGRPLRTEIPGRGVKRAPLAILYRRDRQGVLVGIDRERDGRTSPARVTERDPTVAAVDVMALVGSVLERHEVELLLGAPVTTSDDARGAARRVTEIWAPDCWVNDPSGIELDAAGLVASTITTCICGFCVDAALPVDARDVEGVDLHWTNGPWVRLDGSVDVTADHGVWTPRGVVEAGQLAAGDEVLDARGSARRLRSVAHLPAGPERLGRNVRTRTRTFAAGGIRFASEPACPPR